MACFIIKTLGAILPIQAHAARLRGKGIGESFAMLLVVMAVFALVVLWAFMFGLVLFGFGLAAWWLNFLRLVD